MLRKLLTIVFVLPFILSGQNHFDNLATGPLPAVSGWTAFAGTAPTTTQCSIPFSSFAVSNTAAIVSSLPVWDSNLGWIGLSPFSGTNILALNVTNSVNVPYYSPSPSRVAYSFTVGNPNFMFAYAIKAVAEPLGHACCDMPGVFVRFYDFLNNPITAASRTLTVPGQTAVCVPADTSGWQFVSGQRFITPSWLIYTENFSAYTGSVVTAEITVANCQYGGHMAYAYFDAMNFGNMISANGSTETAGSFTSCSQTATLSANGYQTYLWSAPPASGVNGSTLSTVTTSVAGVYTLLATQGSISNVQTYTLGFASALPVTIASSSFSICENDSVQITAFSPSAVSYSWNNGFSGSSFFASPDSTSQYFVTASHTNGCSSSASLAILVFKNPDLTAVAIPSAVCAGNTLQLSAYSNAAVAYSWTGCSASSVCVVNPGSSTAYTAVVTGSAGCTTASSVPVAVMPLPNFQVNSNPSVVCVGENVFLTCNGDPNLSYSWSNGGTGTSTVTQAQGNSVLTVTANALNGCQAVRTVSLLSDDCLGAREHKSGGALLVFPNPSDGDITVVGRGGGELTVTDQLGRVLRRLHFSAGEQFSFCLFDLEPGLYFLVSGGDKIPITVFPH